MQILWILAEDDKEKLIMYEVFMSNTVNSEENYVSPKGLPGYHPPATGNNKPYLDIVNDMQMQLSENNTIPFKTITCVKSLSTYLVAS